VTTDTQRQVQAWSQAVLKDLAPISQSLVPDLQAAAAWQSGLLGASAIAGQQPRPGSARATGRGGRNLDARANAVVARFGQVD
jgi:hypothetical protein